MKSAFLVASRQLEVHDVELPVLGPNHLRAGVLACGVCASNIHQWQQPARLPPSLRATPGAVGHEIAAVVLEVGDAVDGLAPGDRIAVEPSAASSCGECGPCTTQSYWFCTNPRPIASFGFAEQIVIPSIAAFPAPTGLTAPQVALTEPIACGVHAIRHSWTADARGRVDGARVVVLGAGMLGLGAAMAARFLGASHITVAARYPHQREAAAELGADEVLEADQPNLENQLRALRPQLVVEAVGARARTFQLAMDVAAKRGEVVVLGHFDELQSVKAARAQVRETRVFFAISYAARAGVHDFTVALDLLTSVANPLAAARLVEFPLSDVQKAFEAFEAKEPPATRLIVTPEERGR